MPIWLAMVTGFAIGTLSGLIGIGGGVMLVPLFIYVFHMDMYTAVGTSLAVIAPMALSGALSHSTRGHVTLGPAIYLILGAILGIVVSGQIISYVPENLLRKCFAGFLLYVAIKLFMK